MGQVSTLLLGLMHCSLAFIVIAPCTWKLLVLATSGYLIRMWGITAGYHRYLSHRAFKTSRGFQFLLAVLGATAMQNGPLWWASWHRRHHQFSDTPRDAHSPVQGGFWHAHLGWFLGGSHDDPDLSNVRDLARYPELVFVENHKWLPLVGYAAVCFAAAGGAGLVWGFIVSTIAVFHATMLINSLAHVWGSRRYATPDESRNNGLLAVMTLGEGWHNNHHHAMTSARQGFFWWEIDVTYYSLRALAALGLIWGLRQPGPAKLAARGPRSALPGELKLRRPAGGRAPPRWPE